MFRFIIFFFGKEYGEAFLLIIASQNYQKCLKNKLVFKIRFSLVYQFLESLCISMV